LALNVKDARLRVTNPDVGGRAVAEVIRAAFVQLMTSEHENGLNPLFEELAKTTPGIRSVSVSSVAGAVSYGDPSLVAPSLQEKVLQQKSPLSEPQGDAILWALPLDNEPRCQNCHTRKPDMRGTLLVAVDPNLTAKTLTQATKTSLDHVMLAGLGRLITSFLDDAASSGGMTSLSLYDPAGQLYHTTQSSISGASLLVERALNEHTALLGRLSDPKRPLLSYVEPLVNDQACQRCHGNARPIRGAIEVTLDRTQEREEQRILLFRGSMTALGTMLVVIFALYLGLRRTVLNPVLEIGAVADRVGAGDLEHEAPVRSGDEIGRLAVRINDMIGGLRKKIELSKFVSQETVRTIDAQDGAIDRIGKRRQMTMLFSDIRGFTAYSEKHEPEEVVEMLNQYLSVQADVVERHGGDIDKYVGDELMARFSGDDMEARAIRCGVEMIEAVASLSKQHGVGEALGVGIGINAGDVVIGAMGSKERMDFTVIGDAVNVAARLCSAAKPGQVLIAADTAAKASLDGINLETLAPLTLKGKSEPLKVFQATRIDVTE
jgi:adenylate cyclase